MPSSAAGGDFENCNCRRDCDASVSERFGPAQTMFAFGFKRSTWGAVPGSLNGSESTVWRLTIVVFMVLCSVADARNLITEGCRLSVQSLPGKNTPLLLEGDGRMTARGVPWLLPSKYGENDVLSLAPDEEITVACPGQRYNVVTNVGLPATSAICPRTEPGNPDTVASLQTSEGMNLKEDQLACDRPAQAEMKREGGTCGRTGRWYQLGFNVTGIGWLPLLGSCVDASTGATLYVEHEIRGRAINAAQKESRRPSSFSKGIADLYDGYDPESAYKKVTQQNTLSVLLGSASMASDVLDVSSLVRGHLSPDGDHLWAPHQWATYFYANVAPQWESINGGHWKVVENLARKIAGKTGKDLKIYTGTNGILKIPNKDGKKVPIYLVPTLKKIPVPEHFWKVIYDPSTQAGIALVAANNPSLGRREMGGALPCPDVCAQHGWPTDLRNDVKKGLVACCTVGQLRSAGFALPAGVRAKKILKGPRHRSH